MSVINPATEATVSIRYVVMSFLNRRNDYSLSQYKRYVQIALEGYQELNLWHVGGIEVVYLHMDAAKTVTLPMDFVDYSKIGVPINGKLRVLTKRDEILLPRTFYGSVIGGEFVPDTGEAVGNTDSGDEEGITNAIFFTDHFRDGQFVGGLYGLPGGIDDCYYRIDDESYPKKIIFSGSTPRSEIVVEYYSTGLKADGSSLVPREMIPALRSYIDAVDTENDKRVSQTEKDRKWKLHEGTLSALRHFNLCFTKDEFLRVYYGTSKQTPKR